MIVDDFSRYSWVFFMEGKDEAFSHARDLILRLQTELPKNAIRGPADCMGGHPRPDLERARPLPDAPTAGVSYKHRQVNL